MVNTKARKRHLRPSISIMLIGIIGISGYVTLGTENTLLCVLSFLTFVCGLAIARKFEV